MARVACCTNLIFNVHIGSFQSIHEIIIYSVFATTICSILILCPFGLKTSSLICQRTTKAVVHYFMQSGFTADVYLDDFYGADSPARAHFAFASLKALLDDLGLKSSPEKDSPPSTHMVCLGVEVDSDTFTLSVPQTWLDELATELNDWSSRHSYSMKQLKSLLRKLSFVTACVKPGRIFMSHLLNALRRLDYQLLFGK